MGALGMREHGGGLLRRGPSKSCNVREGMDALGIRKRTGG